MSEKTLTLFHDAWLSQHHRPARIAHDNGSEFKQDFKALCKECKINQCPTTVKNPQASGIAERTHPTANRMIGCFDLNTLDLDPKDPFGEIIARVGWAAGSMHHATLQATPGQLVFGRDVILNANFAAAWRNVCKRK